MRATLQAMRVMDMAAAPPGFEEKSFFEYHLYTLGRPTTIANNSTKQIELFDAATRVPAKKQLVYYGPSGDAVLRRPRAGPQFGPGRNTKVDVYLKFRERQGLGHGHAAARGPDPRVAAGQGRRQPRVHRRGHHRAHAEGRDRAREARHAFDVVGERRQTDFRIDTTAMDREDFEIKVRNHKDRPST